MCLCILAEKKFEFTCVRNGIFIQVRQTFPFALLLSHFTPGKLFFETSFTVVLYICFTFLLLCNAEASFLNVRKSVILLHMFWLRNSKLIF